jgi:hypothetical protein
MQPGTLIVAQQYDCRQPLSPQYVVLRFLGTEPHCRYETVAGPFATAMEAWRFVLSDGMTGRSVAA